MSSGVDFGTFRRVLAALESSDASLRIRLSGEAWREFSKLILLSESAMILQNGDEQKLIINIRSAVEFEVDQVIQGLSPFTPYAESFAYDHDLPRVHYWRM